MSVDLIYQMGVAFEQAWESRVEIDLDGIVVPVIGRAAFLANKRASGRPKDLGDVELVLRHHPEDR